MCTIPYGMAHSMAMAITYTEFVCARNAKQQCDDDEKKNTGSSSSVQSFLYVYLVGCAVLLPLLP